MQNRDISLLSEIYTRQKVYMKGDTEKTRNCYQEWSRTGLHTVPVLFNTYVDEAFKELEEEGAEISRNLKIHHVCYADDIAIFAENLGDLNRYLSKLSNTGKK